MRFWHLLTVNDILLRLKVLINITLKYLHDLNAEYSDTAVDGSIFKCGCYLKTFDLIWLSRTVQRTYFIIYEWSGNLLNWNKLVDKIITYCFIEWNNIIRVEIYFGSSITFLEGNKC